MSDGVVLARTVEVFVRIADVFTVSMQVCQAKQMWSKPAVWLCFFFQEASLLISKLSRSFPFSLGLCPSFSFFFCPVPSKAHADIQARHSISVWLSKLKFHITQFS